MKERWFNFRPICLVFAFLLLGSVFSFFISTHLVITIITTVIVSILIIIVVILRKKPQYFLIPLISFCVGISAYYIATSQFNKTFDYVPTTIEARIYNISNEKDGMILFEADSVSFDGERINDNILIYVYDNDGLFEYIKVGNIIKFSPYNFYKSDLFYNEIPNSYLFSNDLKYTISVLNKNVEYVSTDKKFAETLKDKIKENLDLGLTSENSDIAYSALFGDKDLLSTKQYDAYKLSGVAHLLAVSGLHVGIVVAILNKLFKMIKVKGWWKFFIIGIFLFLYSYVCGFSISVVRASIMSLILLIANITGREYDSFNSISIAGIIIFLINPLCIFDVGFLLSFSCVLGITMLNMSLQRALSATKMPETFVKSVSISLSTTISIVFVMAFFFKTLNIISIVANVILIPIFTLGFVVVFIVSLLSLILPMIAYLLQPLNYVFDFINLTATFLGNLSISNFNTLEFNYILIILYFVLLLFMSRFCTAKYQYKIMTTLPIVALLVYCLI